jgi:Galactose oxidase, central domain/Kelch motif
LGFRGNTGQVLATRTLLAVGHLVMPRDYGRNMGRTTVSMAVCVITLIGMTGCAGDQRVPHPNATNSPSKPATVSFRSAETLRLTQPRAVHRATLLNDGRVLVVGGCTEPGCGGFDAGRSSELFDPATHGFEPGLTMHIARASGTATLLRDSRVLFTGGYPGEGQAPTATAELFDPVTNTFASAANMTTPRADHTATLLPNGKVLLCGGYDATGAALRSTELFDPRTGHFTPGPEMTTPRAGHAAVRIGHRTVLIGGTISGRALATTDVFDGESWTPGPDLLVARVKHAAVALPDRRILVIGGASSIEGRRRFDSTEFIDLKTGEVSAGPSLSQGEYKLDGAVAQLPDGRVVIAGGNRIDLFDPRTNTVSVLARPVGPQLAFLSATTVGQRQVLIAGGYDRSISPTRRAILVTIPLRGG